MRTYKADSKGDILLPPVIISGTEATAQRLTNHLRYFLGEWAFNVNGGRPFFRDIIAPGRAGPDAASIVLTAYILELEDIDELSNIEVEYNPDTRSLRFAARVISETDGELDFDVELGL